MKKTWSILIALFLVIHMSFASAITVSPNSAPSGIVTEGTVEYQMSIIQADQIEQEHTITIGLYTPDTYTAEQVKTLTVGDAIVVNSQVIEIAEILDADDGIIELIPAGESDSYLVLIPVGETSYIAMTDDWTPCTFVAEMVVPLPLPEGFVYISGPEEIQYTADDFIQELLNGAGDSINPYNTTVTLENGVISVITHNDYPEGPAAPEEPTV